MLRNRLYVNLLVAMTLLMLFTGPAFAQSTQSNLQQKKPLRSNRNQIHRRTKFLMGNLGRMIYK